MRNISAVQGPMPRTWTSLAFNSSSVSESTSPSGTVPSATLRARSVMAASLEPLTPAARIEPAGRASTAAGSRPSAKSFRKRPRMADAAAPASCWYMIERTSAAKPSGLASRRSMGPARWMSLAIAGSRRATSLVPLAISRAVSSPFMGRCRRRRRGLSSPFMGRCRRRRRRGCAVLLSGEFAHELRELVGAQAQLAFLQVFQRPLRDVLGGGEVVHRGVDVKKAGHQMALSSALLDHAERRPAVGGVVVLTELLEPDVRTVVELNVPHGAWLVVDLDLFEERDERHVRDRLFVVLDPAVALGRPVVVVEGDARRDDVEDRRAAMRDRRLDQRHHLLAVAAERAGDERAAERERDGARVDGLEGVDRALLLDRA